MDDFLDFHYSVIGEYIELGNMAIGQVEEVIESKLFGPDFTNKLVVVSSDINSKYDQSVDKHISTIK